MDVLPPHTHHHFATTTPSSLRTRIPSTTSFSSYTSTSYSHPRSVSASPISSPINAFSTFSTLSSLNHAPLTTSTKSSQDLLKDVFAFDFASLLELASRSARSVIRCNAPLPGSKPVPSLLQFITTVVKSSGVGSGVIIASIIYLERLRKKLPTTARGMHCTAHRIFLASLILATKFLHDRPIRNRAWAHHSLCFSLQDLNLMERQLLGLLDFRLALPEDEIIDWAWSVGVLPATPIMEDEELVGMEESEDDVILDDDEDEEEEEDSIQVVAGRAIKSILSTPHLAASIDSGCDISRSSTPHPIVASSIDSTRTLFTVKPSLESTDLYTQPGSVDSSRTLYTSTPPSTPLSMKPITASPDGIRQPPTLPIHIRQHQRHVASSFPPPLSPKRKPGEEGKRQRKRVSLTPGMSTWWNVLMFGGQ